MSNADKYKDQIDQHVKRLQDNLKVIRTAAGWTTETLGELLGVTKQTISNLETQKNKMNLCQYYALRYIIAMEIQLHGDENPALVRVVSSLLDEKVDETILNMMENVEGGSNAFLNSSATVTMTDHSMKALPQDEKPSKLFSAKDIGVVTGAASLLAFSPIGLLTAAAISPWLIKQLLDKKKH